MATLNNKKKPIDEENMITSTDVNYVRLNGGTYLLKRIQANPLIFKDKIEEFYKSRYDLLSNGLVDNKLEEHNILINKLRQHNISKTQASGISVPPEIARTNNLLSVINNEVCMCKEVLYEPQYFKISRRYLAHLNCSIACYGLGNTDAINNKILYIRTKKILSIPVVFAHSLKLRYIYVIRGKTFHSMEHNNALRIFKQCTGDATSEQFFNSLDDKIMINSVNCFSLGAASVCDLRINDFITNENIISVKEQAEGGSTWKI